MARARAAGVLRHRLAALDPWTVVEGEFLMLWANNLPWAATVRAAARPLTARRGAYDAFEVFEK